jgi:peptidoglycan/LPS O-acetylase OafA/YrhL
MVSCLQANTSLLVANLGTDSGQKLEEVFETFTQQFTLGSSLAVDTFFFLSGLLTTFTLLKRMRKTKSGSFPGWKFMILR